MSFSNVRTFLIFALIFLLNFSVKNVRCKPFSKMNNEKTRELVSTLEKFLSLYYDNQSQNIEEFEKNHDNAHKHSKKHKNNELFLRKSKNDHDIFDLDEKINERNAKTQKFENYDQNSDDIYDRMQGDQPRESEISVSENENHDNTETIEDSQLEAIRAREKLRKENWVEYIKSQILRGLGRENVTSNSDGLSTTEDPTLSSINISDIIPTILNTSNFVDDDQITEKIRSFYPSCESPSTDTDVWKDEDIMNLYFDIDYLSGNTNSKIATATLRLYRIPQNGTSNSGSGKDNNCDNLETSEEEKLLRVTVYWYTKSQKKRRGKHVTEVKRRLSDSRVVAENARWVELSVKPATKAWNKVNAKNLGLGVLVEDQEGKTLRADKYFKGAACTVGMSTPKPIPTIIKDVAIGQSNELDRIHSLLGRDSNSTVHSVLQLLPSVDICFLEFPENFNASHFDPNRINACNLRKAHEENQRLAERERQERLVSFSEYLVPLSRHIRHQRQHLASKMAAEEGDVTQQQNTGLEFDIRSRIANRKIVMTREELENFTQDKNKFVHR